MRDTVGISIFETGVNKRNEMLTSDVLIAKNDTSCFNEKAPRKSVSIYLIMNMLKKGKYKYSPYLITFFPTLYEGTQNCMLWWCRDVIKQNPITTKPAIANTVQPITNLSIDIPKHKSPII